MKRLMLAFLGMVTLALGCQETLQVPKPRTYPRIEFPKKAYQTLRSAECPFQFEYPKYANAIKDSTSLRGPAPNDCWMDIHFPDLNGYIHCTYHTVGSEDRLNQLISDEFKLTDKHHVKADFVDEINIDKGNGVKGMIFEIEGAVATNLQFYLTDEKDHFMRGALYFKTKARPDSIAPVYAFVKDDIIKMIDTFQWK